MTRHDDELDAVIAAWMESSAPSKAPASLRATLDDVTADPPRKAGSWRRASWQGSEWQRAGRRSTGSIVLRGLAMAAAIAVLAAGGLLGVYLSSRQAATSPSPTARPSSTAATLTLAAPQLVATLDAGVPTLAAANGYVLASGWSPRVGSSSCPTVPVIRFSPDGSKTESTAWPGQILALSSSTGPWAIALDAKCSLKLLSDPGADAKKTVSLAAAEGDFESDRGILLDWSDALGLVYWDGRTTTTFVPFDSPSPSAVVIADAVAPLGFRDGRLYVLNGSRRIVPVHAPTAGAAPTVDPALQTTLPPEAEAPAVLFGDNLIYSQTTGGLGVASLYRPQVTADVLSGFDVWRLSAGPGYVAALGVSDGKVSVAVATDARHWTIQPLPGIGTKLDGGSVALVAAPGHVYAAAPTMQSAGMGIYAFDVAGVPAPTPSPTPPPGPTATPRGVPAITPRPTVAATTTVAWQHVPHAMGVANDASGAAAASELTWPVVIGRPDGGFISALKVGTSIHIDASPDGLRWTRQATLTGSALLLSAMYWDGRQYVLVEASNWGSWPASGGPPGVDQRALTFTSPDGVHWTAHAETGLGGVTDTTRAAVHQGVAVVAGWNRDVYQLWKSSDGIDWTQPSGWDPGWAANVVFADAKGFVAAGFVDATGQTGIWTSPDGQTWTGASVQLPSDLSQDFRGAWIDGIADGPDGYVAVGRRLVGSIPASDGSTALIEYGSAWASGDGKTWLFSDVPELDGLTGAGFLWTPQTFLMLGAANDGSLFLLDRDRGKWNKWTVPGLPPPSGATSGNYAHPQLVTDGTHLLIDTGVEYFAK